MINALTLKEEVFNILEDVYKTQNEAIEKTARLMADCIENDGVIHVFGSGHSVGMGIDISMRNGTLYPIHLVQNSDAVTSGKMTFDEFAHGEIEFERRSGVAQFMYDLYPIKKNDIFFVISNSGINGVGIDFAMLAKQNGHKVIVVTSMQHTLAENSRHPSGKKLYQLGDIVIDNCCPHGDALLQSNGIEKVCAASSISNNFIAQTAACRALELLVEDKCESIPVITGDKEHDYAIRAHYGIRV